MLENQVNTITYIDAWSHWFNGESVSTYFLWNIQIIWLGRAGKLIGFISAFTILLELIGSDRLRGFGKSLHNRIVFENIITRLKTRAYFLMLFWNFIKSIYAAKERKETDKLADELTKSPVTIVVSILALMTAGLTFYKFYSAGLLSALILSFLVWILTGYLGGIIIVLIMALPSISLLLLDLLVIEPTAWILERETLDKIIKIGSFILFIIGFHFDLLAS